MTREETREMMEAVWGGAKYEMWKCIWMVMWEEILNSPKKEKKMQGLTLTLQMR